MKQLLTGALVNKVFLGQVLALAAAIMLMWGVALYPAYLIGGENSVIGLSLAAAFCFIPGVITFWISSISREARPWAVLSGTVIRLVMVAGLVLGARFAFPELMRPDLLLWTVLFYLLSLAIETTLLLRTLTDTQEKQST